MNMGGRRPGMNELNAYSPGDHGLHCVAPTIGPAVTDYPFEAEPYRLRVADSSQRALCPAVAKSSR